MSADNAVLIRASLSSISHQGPAAIAQDILHILTAGAVSLFKWPEVLLHNSAKVSEAHSAQANSLCLPPSWSINCNAVFVPQCTLAAAVRLTCSKQNEGLPGGLICTVCSSFKRNWKLSMHFMVHAALKAKSLNSCPGEAHCRNAWHS